MKKSLDWHVDTAIWGAKHTYTSKINMQGMSLKKALVNLGGIRANTLKDTRCARAPAPFIGPWQGANEQSAEQPGQVTCEVADCPHICRTRLPLQMMDLIFLVAKPNRFFCWPLFDSGLNPPHKAVVGFPVLMFVLFWTLGAKIYFLCQWSGLWNMVLWRLHLTLEPLRSCIAILFKV